MNERYLRLTRERKTNKSLNWWLKVEAISLRSLSWASSFLCLLLFLDERSSDSIHVGGTLVGEGLSSALLLAVIELVLNLANESLLFELLQAVSDELSCSLSLVRRCGSPSLFATVVGSQSWNSNLASDVKLISDGGSSYVEPVRVIRGQFLEASGLNVCSPLLNIINIKIEERDTKSRAKSTTYIRDLELVSFLKMLSEGFDEFLSGDVFHTHCVALVNYCQLDLVW